MTTLRRYGQSVCTYAFIHYKLHYACIPCRISFKRHPSDAGHTCPRCAGPLLCAGHDFAAPRRTNRKAWSVVAVVLGARLRYESFEPCGCGRNPKFRPRTRAQLRARRRVATRTGTPLAELLGQADPLENR
ncbi:hypothetical protein [Streptomyces zaomyceticus]|uniref:hypothetical protein n=1 Tax=Streptomyces zaomyceticus TaxID=68286 RepID=UPI0037AF062B